MIIHNKIHEALCEFAEHQGWNEESEITHLVGFIHSLRDNADIPTDFDPEWHFRNYLGRIQAEENEMTDAVCENCGAPCDYNSEVCLCIKCEDSS